MKCNVNFVNDVEYRSYVNKKLNSYNNVFSAAHIKSRREGFFKYFDIRLEEEKNGGLIGTIYWNIMEIDDFYINEHQRGKGIGQALLLKALDVAHELKLSYILINTIGYSSRDFFHKFGFRVVGEITDYPPGVSCYIMKHVLNYNKQK